MNQGEPGRSLLKPQKADVLAETSPSEKHDASTSQKAFVRPDGSTEFRWFDPAKGAE